LIVGGDPSRPDLWSVNPTTQAPTSASAHLHRSPHSAGGPPLFDCAHAGDPQRIRAVSPASNSALPSGCRSMCTSDLSANCSDKLQRRGVFHRTGGFDGVQCPATARKRRVARTGPVLRRRASRSSSRRAHLTCGVLEARSGCHLSTRRSVGPDPGQRAGCRRQHVGRHHHGDGESNRQRPASGSVRSDRLATTSARTPKRGCWAITPPVGQAANRHRGPVDLAAKPRHPIARLPLPRSSRRRWHTRQDLSLLWSVTEPAGSRNLTRAHCKRQDKAAVHLAEHRRKLPGPLDPVASGSNRS
jgi:hypothetical protein